MTTRPDAIASRSESSLFYAQSWALTEMLLVAPDYREHFPELVSALASGVSSAVALTRVYGKSLDAITSDMRNRLSSAAPPMSAPGLPLSNIRSTSSVLTPLAANSLLAELLLASGELSRAEVMYRDLARESPGNPEISAALGTIALRRGDKTGAQSYWKQALAEGIADPVLCFHYAVLAGDSGVAEEEIRPALERAIELKPDFDDARFQLALIENNSGHYGEALGQLAAMREVSPARRFSYWLTTAYAQDQLAMHTESKLAAQKALGFAATEGERTQASELAYVADTELTVQFTRDAHGNPQVTTTRVARGTQTWNPFVEPQDQMHRAHGLLRAVECGANEQITGFAVDTTEGALKLTIPDPQHVLIRGDNEFTCGPQAARSVTVDYAASPNKRNGEGVLRGMEVLPK
jgi:tetratricopeptide (TPR) repeat protein